MFIREACENDIRDILALLKTMDGEEADLKKSLEIYEKTREYPNYNIFVAEDCNGIIASYSLIIIDNIGHNGKKLAIVENVIVDPEYRGKGIGTLMMNHAMKKAKEGDCYKLMLSSNIKRTKAHEFYEGLGFKQHGISFMVEI